ncbi:hypothetical protein [Litoreibacter roseus]|uniref:Alpha/beta hydrolase family protein n=1 Tax=Litoreibacter roseus TaxID=2601869 RepID=A0A6N6JL53_9RHOB|nr:hypothetical protein [Litoreibacter roseus]GFE66677.1 hypothetical protein KIN_37510 [Litoreibacter roseus]
MTSQTSAPVKKRRVFYIPGYDPFPARRYRELYRTESKEQAKISGYRIDIKGKGSGDARGWDVRSLIDGHMVDTSVDVLVWSDLVQHSMAQDIPRTYWQLVKTSWIYITSGALQRLMRLRKGPIIAALYPIGMLLLQLMLALIAGDLISSLIHSGIAWILPDSIEWLIGFLTWPVFIVVAVVILRWFKEKDGWFFAHYLMHDYAYSAQHSGETPGLLEVRMGEFREKIVRALAEPLDEVLVVGHSSGAHLAVSVLADLLREGTEHKPALAFLSLGQVIPMVSFLPKANVLRADLKYLSAHPGLTWVDVSAPGDGCSFALCDPVAVTGVAPEDKRWPLVLSAAFTQSLTPEKWKELRWRFFRLHFQYLCAFDRPKDYDYFQITAGPMTLAERYQDRAPSRSRIDVAASRYRSTAA